jgi:hypothetical protein
MSKKHLATYLNNHLSASVTILSLLASLEEEYPKADLAQFFGELRTDIEAEQQELEALMARLDIGQDKPRQAAGWIAQRLSQLKLRWDDAQEGPLYLVEVLELLLTGIEGKQALWRGLDAAALPGDFGPFVARSEAQQRRVDALRLEAVKAAFAA